MTTKSSSFNINFGRGDSRFGFSSGPGFDQRVDHYYHGPTTTLDVIQTGMVLGIVALIGLPIIIGIIVSSVKSKPGASTSSSFQGGAKPAPAISGSTTMPGSSIQSLQNVPPAKSS